MGSFRRWRFFDHFYPCSLISPDAHLVESNAWDQSTKGLCGDLVTGQTMQVRHGGDLPLPSGNITYRDKPDVLIAGERTIGIELTNFYLAPGGSFNSEQVQRKRREAAVAEGHWLYQGNGGKNIELTFSFDKDQAIQNVGQLAAKLAAFGRCVEGLGNGEIRRDVFRHLPELNFAHLYAGELQYPDESDPMFPKGRPDATEGLATVAEYIRRRDARALSAAVHKPLTFPARWKVGQVHKGRLMSPQGLQEIVTDKDAKAKKYERCDAYWLLVLVEYLDSAQEQEIRLEGLSAKSFVFEKIFVYKTVFNQIVEVTVT